MSRGSNRVSAVVMPREGGIPVLWHQFAGYVRDFGHLTFLRREKTQERYFRYS